MITSSRVTYDLGKTYHPPLRKNGKQLVNIYRRVHLILFITWLTFIRWIRPIWQRGCVLWIVTCTVKSKKSLFAEQAFFCWTNWFYWCFVKREKIVKRKLLSLRFVLWKLCRTWLFCEYRFCRVGGLTDQKYSRAGEHLATSEMVIQKKIINCKHGNKKFAHLPGVQIRVCRQQCKIKTGENKNCWIWNFIRTMYAFQKHAKLDSVGVSILSWRLFELDV